MDWKSRRITTLLETALLEDKALNDVTTALTIDPTLRATGTIIAKETCIVSGIGCISSFLAIFSRMSTPTGPGSARFEVVSHPEIFDGVRVRPNQAIAVVRANAAAILSTERVILNLMQRMSGIATFTNQFVQAIAAARFKAKILDTRKTIPGLRALDKYAVCCGGGQNHRHDLQDGILIKNNHISLGGGLPAVLERARAGRKPGQMVQVEVRTRTELEQAIAGGADALLLDNMSLKETAAAVKLIRKGLPGATIEASGNMNLKTVADYAKAGVDYISVGALTHSAPAADLSMKITAATF